MISIGKVRDADYYLAETHADDIHHYYAGNERVGVWTGGLAKDLGLAGGVEPADFRSMLDGTNPNTGQDLRATLAKVPAFDIAASVDKGSSLIRGLGDARTRTEFDLVLKAGGDDVVLFLEEHAIGVRRGHAGAEAHNATGLAAAVFHHHHSREGDPQEHLHIVIMNAAKGPDCRITALDSRKLYSARYTAEAVFQASFRKHAAERLGLAFADVDRHGVGQIAGIPEPVRKAFSQRRAQIEAVLNERGTRSATAARIAALSTRAAKGEPRPDELIQAEWRERAIDLDFSVDDIPRLRRTPILNASDEALAYAVTEHSPTFNQLEAIRQVAIAATDGATYDQVRQRATDFLATSYAIEVAPDTWTTQEILDLEQRSVTIATDPNTGAPKASTAAVEQAIAERPTLGTDQAALVRTIATSGRTVDVVIGKAGAGKTYALDTLRSAFEAEGHRVIGAALAARAARELQSGAGIRSTTAHALIGSLDTGRTRLDAKTVVVIDEAGMLPTRQFAALLFEIKTAGAKAVFVGDYKQLPEIEAGGLFAAIASRVPTVYLSENRRQRNPAERQALDQLRAGDIDNALAGLQQTGNVTVAATADQARTALVADWYGSGREANGVMIASHRSDAVDLNERARDLMVVDGVLGPVVLEHGPNDYRSGDRILTHANRYDLGLINGMTGTVVGAIPSGLVVDLEAERRRALIPNEYLDDGYVTHGYAFTIHKAQGMTADECFVLGDDTIYAEMGYTGLTRGRNANRLYIVASRDEDGHLHDDNLADIRRSLATSRAQTAALDLIKPGGTR